MLDFRATRSLKLLNASYELRIHKLNDTICVTTSTQVELVDVLRGWTELLPLHRHISRLNANEKNELLSFGNKIIIQAYRRFLISHATCTYVVYKWNAYIYLKKCAVDYYINFRDILFTIIIRRKKKVLSLSILIVLRYVCEMMQNHSLRLIP